MYTIPVKDEVLKAEIDAAFMASYGNPDNLSGEEMVVKHVSNYIRGVLNDYRERVAQEAVKDSVEKVEELA